MAEGVYLSGEQAEIIRFALDLTCTSTTTDPDDMADLFAAQDAAYRAILAALEARAR